MDEIKIDDVNNDIQEIEIKDFEDKLVSSDEYNNLGENIRQDKLRLRENAEVQSIARSINNKDINSILEFGDAPAVKISKFADQILNNIKASNVEDSKKMFKQLNSIMTRFDKNDFEDKPTLFEKILKKTTSHADKLMNKYKAVGTEMDGVYRELVTYKTEVSDSNVRLERLYEENLNYYTELEKYIVAGGIVVEKMEKEELAQLEKKASEGNPEDVMALENMKTAIDSMKQRIYDLETAKMVALQTAPQIRLIQRSNYKLVSKIHSAFIITMPVFKSGIVQAIATKRQKIVADSLNELDRTTNELLLKNAENIKLQSVDIAKMAGSTSVKIETLEKTWTTILQGIKETSLIEEENKKIREEGIKKLDQMTGELKLASSDPKKYAELKEGKK